MKSAVRMSRGLLDAISAQNGVVLGGPARLERAAMARWHGRGARRRASRAMHNYFGEDFVHRGAPRGARASLLRHLSPREAGTGAMVAIKR